MKRFKTKAIALLSLISVVAWAGNSTYIKGPTLIESVASVYSYLTPTQLTKDYATNIVVSGPGNGALLLPWGPSLPVGRRFRIKNEASLAINLDLYSGTITREIPVQGVVEAILLDNSVYSGTWSIDNGISLYVPNGGVVFGNAAGNGITYDASNLFWDNSNKRLGVGTASPQTDLHVDGTIRSSDLTSGGPVVSNGSGNLLNESPLSVAHGGTNSSSALSNNRLIISSGGQLVEHSALNVGRVMFPSAFGLPTGSASLYWNDTLSYLGIGTSSPAERIDVSGGRGFRYSNNSSTGNIDAASTTDVSSIRFTGAATVTVRGLANGSNGKEVVLTNVTGGDLTIANQNGTPNAEDRIITGTSADMTVSDGASVWAKYDSSTLRWRIIGGSGSGGGGGSPSTTYDVKIKTANYTASGASDDVILGDASASRFAITLPSAASNCGKAFFLKKIDLYNLYQVDIYRSGSDLIDGETAQALKSSMDAVKLISDCISNWFGF